MIIVLDSNVFISALIKEGITRKIIVSCKERLVAPEYLFQEIRKHKNEILSKSKLAREDYMELISILLKYIVVIPDEVILPYREKALEIVQDIDKDDALFFATALAFDNSVIWSDDKKLKSQNIIRIINTEEIAKLLI